MLRAGLVAAIPMVTCAWRVLRACQEPVQRPSLRDVSDSGGSPVENVATTEPEIPGSPQSSTTFASTVMGQAAGAVNPEPSDVGTGNRRVGAHPAALREEGDPTPEPAPTTRRSAMVRAEPSANWSVSVPRWKPGLTWPALA